MSANWPTGVRCPVMLSFDVDGCSPWISWKPKFANWPSLMSMGEYGPAVGVPRILKLLADYEIPATFFIPGYIAETHPEMVQAIHQAGHEIGHHNYMHELPLRVSPEEELEIMERSSSILEGLTGQRPLGYRAPAGEVSPHTLRYLKEMGFHYDTSLMGHDEPYLVESGAGPMIELPMAWVLDDYPFFAHAPLAQVNGPMVGPSHVYDVWAAEFDGLYDFESCFVLCMHPWIMGRPARVQMLERLIRHIRSRPGAVFRRMIDVADEWGASAKDRPAAPLLPPPAKYGNYWAT